jgi:hypothetical protein
MFGTVAIRVLYEAGDSLDENVRRPRGLLDRLDELVREGDSLNEDVRRPRGRGSR